MRLFTKNINLNNSIAIERTFFAISNWGNGLPHHFPDSNLNENIYAPFTPSEALQATPLLQYQALNISQPYQSTIHHPATF